MALRDRPWWQRGPALPLLISATAHGLLLLLLAAIPWREAAGPSPVVDTRIVVDVGVLSLAPDSTRHTSAAGGSEEEREPPPPFSVNLIDPPPAGSPVILPAPIVVMPTGAGGIKPPIASHAGSSDPEGAGPDKSRSGGGGRRFFPDLPDGQSVVYVIDRSLSMGLNQAWARSREELLASLERLRPTDRFQVIPYNRQAEPLRINGRLDLLPADVVTLSLVRNALLILQPTGGTDHVRALQRGLALCPDLLWFVTDADELSQEDVNRITRINRGATAIHVLSLSSARDDRPASPLRELARLTRGTYRQVWQR